MIYTVDQLLESVDTALTTAPPTVEEFVNENGLPAPRADPENDVGLPWVLGQAANDADLAEWYGDFSPAGVRQPLVLDVESNGANGSVAVFVRVGLSDSVGFGPEYYVYFACVEIDLDLEKGISDAVRIDCPTLPDVLTDLAKPLPENYALLGEPWP